jgi:hypothetical protein
VGYVVVVAVRRQHLERVNPAVKALVEGKIQRTSGRREETKVGGILSTFIIGKTRYPDAGQCRAPSLHGQQTVCGWATLAEECSQAMADRLSLRRTSSRIRTVIETKEGQVGPRPESRLEKSIVSGSLHNRHLGKTMFLVQICHACKGRCSGIHGSITAIRVVVHESSLLCTETE